VLNIRHMTSKFGWTSAEIEVSRRRVVEELREGYILLHALKILQQQ